MMIDFQYADELASDYMLVPCRLGTTGVETVEFGSQLSNDTIRIVGTDERPVINNDYSSTLSIPPIQLCKFDSSRKAQELTAEEYSKINRWLNRKESHKFKPKETSYENIYFLGKFNIQAIKINDILYGVEVSFVSDYPYGFMDEIKIDYENTTNFIVYNHSDETGDIYPYVTITCLKSGNLSINNSMDNEIFEIDNCTNGEVIVIDNKNRVITTSNESHVLCEDFNYNYLKLINNYNSRLNNFTSSLPINIEIKYSPIRKVGV